MARAFPKSRFTGSDYHEESIIQARKRAADAGLAAQVRYEVASAQTFNGGPYDLVTTFDSLHDMGDGGRGDAPRWPSGIDAERPPRVRPG